MQRVLTERRRKSLRLRVIEMRRKVKEQAVAYKGGKCTRCGIVGLAAIYDFHHPDPTQKDFAIGSGNYKSFVKLKAELDKTVLLCSNCHRMGHDEENVASFNRKKEALLAETPPKKGAPKLGAGPRVKISVACSVCGVVIETIAARLGRIFTCSEKCAARVKGREPWPSDDELGRLVWQVTTAELAKRFGVRDVAVKRRCKKRGIQTPPIGYWTSKSRAWVAAAKAREKALWPSDEELAQLVWKVPVTTLAKQLGVSDVAIKKRCNRRGINTPPRGYWHRTRRGKCTGRADAGSSPALVTSG